MTKLSYLKYIAHAFSRGHKIFLYPPDPTKKSTSFTAKVVADMMEHGDYPFEVDRDRIRGGRGIVYRLSFRPMRIKSSWDIMGFYE